MYEDLRCRRRRRRRRLFVSFLASRYVPCLREERTEKVVNG